MTEAHLATSLSGALSAWDWLDLFLHFMSLSLLSIGGAITTAPEMHRYLVNARHWLSDAQFTSSIALAQAALVVQPWSVSAKKHRPSPPLSPTAVAQQGMIIEVLSEHPEYYWDAHPLLPWDEMKMLPHTYVLIARKPGE